MFLTKFTSKRYAPLAVDTFDSYVDEDIEKSCSRESDASSKSLLRRPNKRSNVLKYWRLSIVLNILLSCSSLLLSFLLFLASQPDDQSLLKAVSAYCAFLWLPTLVIVADEALAPIFDKVEVSLSSLRMNTSFVNSHPASIYRGDPSPEVDAAWHRIANVSPISLSTAEVDRLGFDSSRTARFPEIFGLGDDAHIARIDSFHAIHCLDRLRKDLHFDYYYNSTFPDGQPNAVHKLHTSHCLHVVLQNLMCNANVDPFMHYWVDTQDTPLPDFSANHKCRDFEAVLQWQEANSIGLAYYQSMAKMPANVTPRIMSDDFKTQNGLL